MVISFSIHKGGSGKTTSVVNVGHALARRGFKTLLVDLDPQSNLSLSLGVVDPPGEIYNSLIDEAPLVEWSLEENLALVPSTIALAEAEITLVNSMKREERLKKALKKASKKYDIILIDCPPSIGLLTLNALAASQFVLVPLQAEFLAASGLATMQRFIEKVKLELNPKIKLLGVFLTQYNSNKNINQSASSSLKKNLGEKLFDTAIRENIKLAEAPMSRLSIFDTAPKSNGAIDYEKLTTEIIKRLKL